MKTEVINGQNVVVLKARGRGDGGMVVRYFIEEADGTFSEVGEWYSDPAAAEKVYAAPDVAHVTWAIGEARRQTVAAAQRTEQAVRPTPQALKVEAEILTVK